MTEKTTAGTDAEFAEIKQRAVQNAERALARAKDRLEKALAEYQVEVERHEERGDGFFSSAYVVARKEAVRARKFFESKSSALTTARAEAEAPRISLEAVQA